jgi:surface antigen
MTKLKILTLFVITGVLTSCGPQMASNPNIGAPNTINNQSFHIDSQSFGDAGKLMDEQDRVNTAQALINIPIGDEAAWTNTKTQTSYIVRPINNYQIGNQYCRNAKLYVNNGKQVANAIACHGPDNKWYLKQ